MIIDPLEIPCAYCGGAGEVTAPERMSMEKRISCRRCRIVLRPAVWITGGLNALIGKLHRHHTYVENLLLDSSDKPWFWINSEGKKGGPFASLDEAALDAWKKMEIEEGERKG